MLMSGRPPRPTTKATPPPSTTVPTSAPPPPRKAGLISVGGVDLGCCVEPSSVIWMLSTLFAFTVFITVFFCIACVACRWVYKRRLKKKCDALREKYSQEEKQRKLDEIKQKRHAMRPIYPFHPRNENEETLHKLAMELNYQGGHTPAPTPHCMPPQMPQPLPSVTETVIYPPPNLCILPPHLHPAANPPPMVAEVPVKNEPERVASTPIGLQDTQRDVEDVTVTSTNKDELRVSLESLNDTTAPARVSMDSDEVTKTPPTHSTANGRPGEENVQRVAQKKGEPTPESGSKKRKRETSAVVKSTGNPPTPRTEQFPYWTTGEVQTRSKKQPIATPSSTSTYRTASTTFRQPNAYEMREFVRTGRPLTSGDDVTQSSRDHLGPPSVPPPTGFSWIRAAANKSLRGCMKSPEDTEEKP